MCVVLAPVYRIIRITFRLDESYHRGKSPRRSGRFICRTYPVCVYVLLLGCALVGNVRILIQLYARDVCRALPCAARAYLFHTDFSR